MDSLYTRFDSIFFEKTRLSLLTIIYQEEGITYNELKRRLGASDGAVYTHIEKLISGGYVEKKKEIAGTNVQTIYRLTKAGITAFQEYLGFLEHIVRSYEKETKEPS
ncbi:MAG: transcriptional regulator [Spirochaetales bacterium]|nr:transcriptional regulator [Spirochaetales bacterium]